MSKSTIWTTALAGCMLVAAPGVAACQVTRAGDPRSTLEGVFTREQALRGEEFYGAMCRSCHTSPGHTPAFKASWSGRPLLELFTFISENMPKDNPGTLTPQENAALVAYLLRFQGLPPGTNELPHDPATLGRIRFDTLTAQPGPLPGRTEP